MLRSRFLKNFDWVLLGLTVLLTCVGLLAIYSTSFKATGVSSSTDAAHQLIFAIVSLAGLFLAARMDYRGWGKLTPIIYIFTIVTLAAVLILGKTALGATRWIDLGFFQFQPSEFSKLAVIVVLAKYFSDHYEYMDNARHLLISFAYVLVPMLLVLAQPDLGTALVLGTIWGVMALIARARFIHMAALAAAALAAIPLIVPHLHKYQRDRLATFLNPTADPLHTGYNVVQSTIAVGSGQVWGRGLAAGSQSQLNFLPSQHTDFIFAVLSEKMGFIGSMLVLLLFVALLLRSLLIASRASDRFGMFLAGGIITMLLFHLFINVGMNIGLMPVTGIPLPFISYGGTSLLVSMLAIGLLESVAVRRRKIEFGT